MNRSTYITRYSIFIIAACVLLCGAVTMAQSDDLNPDNFESDDAFLAYVLGGLFDDDTSSDTSDTDVENSVYYNVIATTSSSVTIETNEVYDAYVVEWYTTPWDEIKYADTKTLESFVARAIIEPKETTNTTATIKLNDLLVDSTYHIVVTPEDLKDDAIVGAKDSVELDATTSAKDIAKSDGFSVIQEALFDRSIYKQYIDGGEHTSFFLGLFLKQLEGKSVKGQTKTIEALYDYMVAMKSLSLLTMGLDGDGILDLLLDAGGNKTTPTKSTKKDSTSKTINTPTGLDISWQVFPSKETDKKIVVFRTNMNDNNVQRATWHFGVSDILGCDRSQCDRLMYELEDNKKHYIEISYTMFNHGELVPGVEKISIDLGDTKTVFKPKVEIETPAYVGSTLIRDKALTWVAKSNVDGYQDVGCEYDNSGTPVCNAYNGDTSTYESLPILCIKKTGETLPDIVPVSTYHGWAAGEIGITMSISGRNISSLDKANQYCEDAHGEGYQIAQHHDGGGPGWNFWAKGDIEEGTRFWVYIRDQDANPRKK